MTDTAIKFDRDATELPDKNGNPTKVGDWVRDEDGQEWQVYELRPTEEHAEGQIYKKLGTLSLDYSYFGAQRYDSDVALEIVRKMTFAGKVQTSRSLTRVQRLDLTPEQLRQRAIARAEALLRNLEAVEVEIRGRLREAERKHRALLEAN